MSAVKFKKIFIAILMLFVFLSGCQEQTSVPENKNDVLTSIRLDCEFESLTFINHMLSGCNEYKNGKSVLNFGEMRLRLELAQKAAEIYERINKPLIE